MILIQFDDTEAHNNMNNNKTHAIKKKMRNIAVR